MMTRDELLLEHIHKIADDPDWLTEVSPFPTFRTIVLQRLEPELRKDMSDEQFDRCLGRVYMFLTR
jgi:hypothetical protein